MIPATPCVLDAFLAVRTVAVHDGEDHVSLEVLGEREDERCSRDSSGQLGGSPHISTTEYLHCARSVGQRVAGWEAVEGGTYAILRHIVCESGGRRRVEGKGCRGGWGEGRGDRMGLNTHVAKFPTEFIEGRGSGHRRRERKRWVDGLSLPFLCCF